MPKISGPCPTRSKPSPPEPGPPDRPRLLGAIIAGGQSRRFGRDKALAILNDKPLLEHVAERLNGIVDDLVVVGREWPGLSSIADRPAPGLGPLGGLCAALHAAACKGFDAVLTAPCDALPLPAGMPAIFPPTGGVVRQSPLVGLWPASLSTRLDDHLSASRDRSVRSWIATCGIAEVEVADPPLNFNTVEEFEAFRANQSSGRPSRA